MGTLRFWTTFSLLCAAAIPLVSLALFFPWVDELPRWDQWGLVEAWEAHFAGRPVLPVLLEPYNGHMNVAPRALFFVLGLATRWSLRTEVLLGYLLASSLAAVLILMLRDSGERFLLLAAPVTLQVFSLLHSTNFTTGYAVGQHLCQLGIAATIFALTRPRISGLHVTTAALAAALATFSWGSGVIAWPLGTLILLARMRWLWTSWIVWGGLMMAALLAVRKGSGHIPPLSYVLHEPSYALFGLAVLGKPISPWGFPTPPVGLLLGVLVTAATTATAVWVLTLRQPPLLLLRWGLLGVSGLGAAVLIALGRAWSPLSQALAPQYAVASYFLPLSLLVLLSHCLWTTRDLSASRPVRWAGGAALALLLAAVAGRELCLVRNMLPTLRVSREDNRQIVDKVRKGSITDEEIRKALHPDPQLVRHGLTVLRRHRMALYRNLPEGETR